MKDLLFAVNAIMASMTLATVAVYTTAAAAVVVAIWLAAVMLILIVAEIIRHN